MGRVEYKYLVPQSKLPALRSSLQPYLELDVYSKLCASNAYTVRSIYFDTPRLANYHDKIAGIKQRRKVRIRGYNSYADDAAIFLEIKRKNGPTINKARFRTDFEKIGNILGRNRKSHPQSIEQNRDLIAFYYQVFSSQLKPVIKVIYEREAYFYHFNRELRITFDTNIRSSLSSNLHELYNERRVVPAFRNYFILEIKTSGEFPEWLTQVIGKFHLQNEALSKYTLNLDAQRKKSPCLEKTILSQKAYLPCYFQN